MRLFNNLILKVILLSGSSGPYSVERSLNWLVGARDGLQPRARQRLRHADEPRALASQLLVDHLLVHGAQHLARLGVATHRLLEEALPEAVVAARPRLAVILVARRLGRRGRLRSRPPSEPPPAAPPITDRALCQGALPLGHVFVEARAVRRGGVMNSRPLARRCHSCVPEKWLFIPDLIPQPDWDKYHFSG
jgi:hypothetical protein